MARKNTATKVVEQNESTSTAAGQSASKNPIADAHTIESLYGGVPGAEGSRTHSAVMRQLSGEGFTRSQIANFLNKRYQHVRNVLTAPVKSEA